MSVIGYNGHCVWGTSSTDRVPDFESVGSGFESQVPHHYCCERSDELKLLVLYLGITFIGYLVGVKLRKSNTKWTWTGIVQTVAIGVLVFFMGARLGADENVIAGLGSIGVISLIMTLLAMGGSIAAITIARKLLRMDRNGVRRDD